MSTHATTTRSAGGTSWSGGSRRPGPGSGHRCSTPRTKPPPGPSAFPTPDQLLGVTSFEGLPDVALRRLHAIAEEARGGALDTADLRTLKWDEARQRLLRLPGIGPFYSELILVRALGHTDVLPAKEPTVREVAAKLLGRDSLSEEELVEMARPWSPWRTWVTVAIRAAGPMLLS